MNKIYQLIFLIIFITNSVLSDIEYNDVNTDGTYSFRHSNDDIGSYYHSATKSGDSIVRGRYGSRNPSNGRIEETIYTAGPRGYRAKGPQIHRKMDLGQFPRGPIGTSDDPLADPYEDPSYGFNFKTNEYERSENADSSGRVNGLYSYLDDIGERHTVRYAAGAGTGYEVTNSVPDSPASVAYSAPLYKAPKWTRGKMSVRRGPGGQYDFILSAPDHRRSETSGPDGIVRGSYSYLDDKGRQRTVQYIAGAGIGFRVVQNTIGPGTHLNPRPALPEYGITDFQTNELDGDGYARPSGSGSRPFKTSGGGTIVGGSGGNNGQSGGTRRPNQGYNKDRPDSDYNPITTDPLNESTIKPPRPSYGPPNRRPNKDDGSYHSSSTTRLPKPIYGPPNRKTDEETDTDSGYFYEKGGSSNSNNNRGNVKYSDRNPYGSSAGGNRGNNVYDDDDYNQIPYVTPNHRQIAINRDRDWSLRSRDSTIIKNVGKWYVNLPPGHAVRAHVQNIDLLPLGGRIPSPSEALRRDEVNGN